MKGLSHYSRDNEVKVLYELLLNSFFSGLLVSVNWKVVAQISVYPFFKFSEKVSKRCM